MSLDPDYAVPQSSLPTPLIPAPRRILVMRLDRIGDVILSTPVLSQLRKAFPHAFIAIMVRPECVDIVQGNPALNEVILYDKEASHKGVKATLRFARSLRRFEFDTALVLHPSNRSHWITWLSGVRFRIGYNRKCGWLLTHRLPHRKQEGKKHEAAYALEFLEMFGVMPQQPEPFVPVDRRALARISRLLSNAAIDSTVQLIAIHPSASCISKRWMPERFAEVADRLVEQDHVRVSLVAAKTDATFADQVAGKMRNPALNLTGKLSVGDLAAFLKRCRLLISNDSGPVHVAAGVGTPVVDIFGRNQRGLSPLRWGPLGENHVILHKEVGCVTCLAHECDIGFLCLSELSVDEVYVAARSILERPAVRTTKSP